MKYVPENGKTDEFWLISAGKLLKRGILNRKKWHGQLGVGSCKRYKNAAMSFYHKFKITISLI